MIKKKKPFKDTLVGGGLIAAASLINPALGGILKGALSVKDAITMIGDSDATHEEKLSLQEFILKQHQAEVQDRVSAREREADVLAAGGSDLLMKTIGWTISITFIVMILVATGIIESDLTGDHRDMFNVAFGAVSAKLASIVSYYFGSSVGSKRKTILMNENNG